MIVSLLTTASLIINVGYQVPQLLLLRQKSKEKSTPKPSGGDSGDSKLEKSPLSGSTILIKTTGLYFAVAFYYQNGVPFLSWIHQITSIMQDWAMIYYWWAKIVYTNYIFIWLPYTLSAIQYTLFCLKSGISKKFIHLAFPNFKQTSV